MGLLEFPCDSPNHSSAREPVLPLSGQLAQRDHERVSLLSGLAGCSQSRCHSPRRLARFLKNLSVLRGLREKSPKKDEYTFSILWAQILITLCKFLFKNEICTMSNVESNCTLPFSKSIIIRIWVKSFISILFTIF